jgi:two-component system, sensor histidine kinase and response regulator
VQRRAFDLVFMDMQMPVMDGVTATREIRKIVSLAQLPIVAMTANAMEKDRQLCLRAGMNDSLTKPIESCLLWSALMRWIPGVQQCAQMHQPEASIPARALEHGWAGVPGLDVTKGLLHARGNAQLYRSLLAQFVASHGRATVQIHSALATGDIAAAERLACTLKAVAGDIGAAKVEMLAADLERALRTYEPPVLVQDRLAKLERPMAELTEAIAAQLERELEPVA